MYGDRHNTQTTHNRPTQPAPQSGITPTDLLLLALLLLVIFMLVLSIAKYMI